MIFEKGKVSDVKITYIGGGSRGWAWGLMSDLVSCEDMSGHVDLYDIDYEAAQWNEIIGNKFNDAEGAKSIWSYRAVEKIEDALKGANFVVISILPGTFDEMESDVHTPEKYGIYQTVGDTTGPGGIVRAMRTIPMYEYFAEKIKECCPKAWVINYTNPMTWCTQALYRVFPEIRAFGCCHEVFGTQKFLVKMVEEFLGLEGIEREEIKVNPVAVNHYTWLTEAKFRDLDLFPMYQEFCEKHKEGYPRPVDSNWMNNHFASEEKVKMDLFLRYGWIAAAGDRHLAEFTEGKYYLENPERLKEMHFNLTTVAWRREELETRLEKSKRLVSGEEAPEIKPTGEEGVNQMRALLGLIELVTNVNIPNYGQIPNLPMGAVVECNAVFRANSLTPVFAGPIPKEIYPQVARVCGEQEAVAEAIANRDVNKIFAAFINDPLTTCNAADAKKMFKEMCENTKEYLSMYDLDSLR